jgi:acyl-CoA thioesterase I
LAGVHGMGFRVARKAAAAFVSAAAIGAVFAATGHAQQPRSTELFQLSGSCAAPDTAVTSVAPLLNLATVLQSRMNVRVLAVGNVASSGGGRIYGQQRYTDELEEILERSVKGLDLIFTHRGVSGEPTSTTAERLKHEIAELDPDLVLWQVGTYDALSQTPVAEFEAVFSGAVEWIKGHGKDLVIVGLQYTTGLSKDPHYRAIKDAIGRVAARHNVLLVRRYEAVQFIATASQEQAKLAKNDFMMTELGYKCMAEHIARAMVVNIFARRATEAQNKQLAKQLVVPTVPAANVPVPAAPEK